MNDIAVIDPMPAVPAHIVTPIDPASAFLPVPWELIDQAAALISSSPGMAPQFKDVAVCRFIAYQSARWGADPIAVAQKTYFTPGQRGKEWNVGYEAQLIHALIEADPDLLEPLQFEFAQQGGRNEVGARYCKVTGRLRGASKPRVVITPTFAQIKVRNSPLWFSDLDQQFAYYGARSWGRRFRPGRILGVYAREEIEAMAIERDEDAPKRIMFEEDEPVGDGEPAPSEAKSEPEDMPALRERIAAEQSKILAMTGKDEARMAWEGLANGADFKRLVAYNQALANTIKGAVAAHVKGLK